MKSILLRSTALVIGLTGLSATAAFAQDAEPAVERTLRQGEIVITARKQEETLLEAPVAVSAFSQDDIEKLQLQSVDDIARFTPGLSFSKAFGRSTERPVIRGQSNVLAGVQFGVESGTAYFLDGVYYPSSISNLDPNEIERVEVIKGPQSALYGRNTYAGAINFITRGGADEFEGSVKASVGSHDEYDLSATFAGPLGGGAEGRITVRRYEYGGEYTNQVTGQTVGQESTFSVGGVLDWEFTPNFTTRTRLMYTFDRDGVIPLFLQSATENNCAPGYRSINYWRFSGSTNNNQYYCGVIAPGQVNLNSGADADGVPNLLPGVPATGSTFFGTPYSLRDGTAFDGIKREQILGSFVAEADLGGTGNTISLLVGVRHEDESFGSDSDHSGVNFFFTPSFVPTAAEGFFANTNRDTYDDYSVELKFTSRPDRKVRYMGGVYIYEQTNDQFDIAFLDTTRTRTDNNIYTGQIKVSNQAIFGLIEADLTDRITVTAEGRYAEEEKSDTSSTLGPQTFDKFAPRFTASYDLANGGTIYGIYAVGVKPGGLNGALGQSVGLPTYAQEESKNIEIGFKTPIGENWSLTAAGYFIEATDVQLTTAVASATGAVNSVVTNQGAGEITGLELDLRGALTDQLNIGVTYAWTVPEFTEGCDVDEWTLTSGGGNYSPIPGASTQFFGQTGSCDIAGNRFPLASEHQASAFFDYTQPIGWGDAEFFMSGDVSYESSKFVQVHNRAETGDATIVGARVGVRKDSWRLTLWGRNLTEEDSITAATRWLQTPYISTGFSLNTAPATASRSAPRAFFGSLRRGQSIGIELKYDF
jgi:outer membrane receptor protein involved in Fe transport